MQKVFKEMLGYCVYVLFSEKDRQLYIGYTGNIVRRLAQHNNGDNISTRNRRPLKLIFMESFLYKYDAIERERYFKTSKGKRAIKLMLRDSLIRLGYIMRIG